MFVVNTGVKCVKTSVPLLNSFGNLSKLNLISYIHSKNHNRVTNYVNNLVEKCSYSGKGIKSVNSRFEGIFSERVRYVQSLANVKSNLVASTQSSKKRAVRKKPLDEEVKSKYSRVYAYSTADEYDVEALKEEFAKKFVYKSTEIDEFKRFNLLHLKANLPNGSDSKEIYIFEEGSIVFWNVPDEERNNLLQFIKQFESATYSESLVQNEQEVMNYVYGEVGKNSDLVREVITLAPDKEEMQSAFDKYTFSNSMAVSVKLGIWECILQCYIANIQLLTDDLKMGKKIRLSRKEVLRKTGELYSLRHAVNLTSDVLDVPDFYWDLETQEKIYLKMCNYFSINRRTAVVNEKLNHCIELLDLLSSELNDTHHVRLEWMIIILITVEVVIAFFHGI